jgi:S1-C subfamily serine protease
MTTSARLLNEARGLVFRVRSTACLATGSSFNTNYGIITNRHVAQGSGTLQLSAWDGTDFDADVEAISSGPDLAILSADGDQAQSVATIDPKPVEPGTRIWAAGYPEGDELAIRPGVALGYISAKWIGAPEKVLEITARVKHGDSGGPVFDAAGDVVGVVFAWEIHSRNAIAVPARDVVSFGSDPGYNTAFNCLF